MPSLYLLCATYRYQNVEMSKPNSVIDKLMDTFSKSMDHNDIDTLNLLEITCQHYLTLWCQQICIVVTLTSEQRNKWRWRSGLHWYVYKKMCHRFQRMLNFCIGMRHLLENIISTLESPIVLSNKNDLCEQCMTRIVLIFIGRDV